MYGLRGGGMPPGRGRAGGSMVGHVPAHSRQNRSAPFGPGSHDPGPPAPSPLLPPPPRVLRPSPNSARCMQRRQASACAGSSWDWQWPPGGKRGAWRAIGPGRARGASTRALATARMGGSGRGGGGTRFSLGDGGRGGALASDLRGHEAGAKGVADGGMHVPLPGVVRGAGRLDDGVHAVARLRWCDLQVQRPVVVLQAALGQVLQGVLEWGGGGGSRGMGLEGVGGGAGAWRRERPW